MSLKNVTDFLRRENNFLITAHANLEGDALGSEIAFLLLAKALGKRAVICNSDPVPYGYDFLPCTKDMLKFSKRLGRLKFDCLVVLDCSELKRTGELARIELDDKIIVNIDHHIGNQNFGQINWVDPSASSASEMIYKLYKKLKVEFNKDIATALYAGILTDTGSFRYLNTASSTHLAAAELMEYGLNAKDIYNKIYENIPFSDMKLLSRVLSQMRRAASGKIIWFEIKRKALEGGKPVFDLGEYILSFGRTVKGAQVVCLFKENLGAGQEVRVNFRSQGKVDVNKIACFFGGGGHKTASGATLKGSIENVRSQVLAKIKESLASIR